ncbi:MAG: GNAT family N-acetyltransferase [Eggerthellaceae bacterium]|nr:GNAT family N-acetyltransferase [Eggerthellaceae bacterium]
MIFRPAMAHELDGVMAIIEDGRASLARLGIDQWQGSTPNESMVRDDMAAGRTMVAVDDDGRLLGTLAFMSTVEPDYSNITWGSWLFDGCDYATLHRVAVAADATRAGVGTFMVQSSKEKASSLGMKSMRVDTHEGNIPMQRLLESCGLTHCCDVDITLPEEQTRKRLGYEILLS